MQHRRAGPDRTTATRRRGTEAIPPGPSPTDIRVTHPPTGRPPQSRRGDARRRRATLTYFPAGTGLRRPPTLTRSDT